MATSNFENACRLCLCCKLIKLESMQINDILTKISKYLLIKLEQVSLALCANCYNSLENFHLFYERVHAAQRSLHSTHDAVMQQIHATSSTQTVNWEPNTHGLDLKSFDHEITDHLGEIDKSCNNFYPSLEYEIAEGNGIKQQLASNTVQYKLDTGKSSEKKDKSVKQKEISSEFENKMMEFYNIKCEKCEDIKFTSFKMLSRHYLSVHNTQGYIKCCKRNIRVNDKSYLRSHMLKHLEPDTCRCTVCGKQLSSTVTLKHHMLLHKPTEERPFQCTECDKRFCCKNDLKNHEKAIHIPENKREDFICDVCGKVFQKVANLRYHHSTIHLQERKYVCELCAKCFTTQSGLRTHMNAAHNTRGPIQCQECSKWLKNEDTFQKHLQLHQNNSYPCSQCSKICNSSTSLRSHMVKHSENRPHTCPICRKAFKTKTHLKNHSVQHSGGSNFKCPFCSKTFVNMSNYYTHRKRMHYNERGGCKPDNLFNRSGGNNNNEDYHNGKLPVIRNSESYLSEHNVNNINNLMYEYKLTKVDESRIDQSENEMPIIRQNIIVSPVKYL